MTEAVAVPADLPAVEKNAMWRASTLPWVLVLDRGASPPDLDALAREVDVVSAQWPLVRPPFAVRREFLEEMDGFAALPVGLDMLDFGIRAWEANARFAEASWIATSDEPRPDEKQLLFSRYPYTWILADPPRTEAVYSSAELGAYLAERSTPPLLEAEDIARALEAARARGLYATGPSDAARFDRYHAENWVLRNTRYREVQLGRTMLHRHPPPRVHGGASAAHVEARLEGRYEVRLGDDALAGLERPTLSLPVPAECPELSDLELFDFDPPELARHVVGTTIERFPVAGRTLGYSFRCRVREAGPTPASDVKPKATSIAPKYAAQLDDILRSLFDDAHAVAPKERARAIYHWVIDSIAVYASDRPGLFALETRTGHCAHRTRLFALLCERVGLAVRERSGLTAGDIVGEAHGRVTTRFVNRGVALAHVWPEVFVDGAWWPVELIGADHGRRVMTPSNVTTPALRRRIRDATPALDAYCFGTVDPYRVYFAEPPKGLVGVPVGEGNRDFAALRRALWATRHVLTIAVDGLSPPHPW